MKKLKFHDMNDFLKKYFHGIASIKKFYSQNPNLTINIHSDLHNITVVMVGCRYFEGNTTWEFTGFTFKINSHGWVIVDTPGKEFYCEAGDILLVDAS